MVQEFSHLVAKSSSLATSSRLDSPFLSVAALSALEAQIDKATLKMYKRAMMLQMTLVAWKESQPKDSDSDPVPELKSVNFWNLY